MADELIEENVEEVVDSQAGDVEMGDEATEGGDARPSEPVQGKSQDEPAVPRVSFAQYLNSPVVSLMVGSGENESILTAHQGLLAKSPYFASLFGDESADGDATVRQTTLPSYYSLFRSPTPPSRSWWLAPGLIHRIAS